MSQSVRNIAQNEHASFRIDHVDAVVLYEYDVYANAQLMYLSLCVSMDVCMWR